MWAQTRRIAAGAVCLWAALVGGCDDETIIGLGTLEVDPPAIDFGKVATGATRVVGLRLRNGSPSADLTIQSMRLADGSAPVFSVGDVPALVPRSGEATVELRYAPDDDEPDLGTLEIRANAAGGGLTLVPLSSARTFARIGVDPQSLDLGALEAGGERRASITVRSLGDATLAIHRASIRTDGYFGEACFDGGACRQGACRDSRSGPICATDCTGGCPSGYACRPGTLGDLACREDDGARAPVSARGFFLEPAPALGVEILPGERIEVPIRYAPGVDHRGSAQLIIESSDAERPVMVVSLAGRPSDQPPVAMASFRGSLPTPTVPGSVIPLSGAGSFDPEGTTLGYRWRFGDRPEGSRAQFEDPTSETTRFTVDRPGEYGVELQVTDAGGLSSTNEAKVIASAEAGHRIRVELAWNRAEADLDLHLVSPGAPVGSIGDCFEENRTPDWAPAGAGGDPTYQGGVATESIEVIDPASGAYSILVRVAAPSPSGPVTASFRLFLEDVEVAVIEASLPASAEAWDVATLSWPSGRFTPLGSIR